MHHSWSRRLVTLAVKIGNPAAPAVKGHAVQSLQNKKIFTACAAILSVSTLKLPHNDLIIASPPRFFLFFTASLQVVYTINLRRTPASTQASPNSYAPSQ